MSYRINKFRSFAADAWFHKKFATLRPADIAWCEAWIAEHDALSHADFDKAAVRLGMDDPDLRASFGKRWGNMDELIANSNVGFGQ